MIRSPLVQKRGKEKNLRHRQKTTCWGEGGFSCHDCHDDSLTEWLDTQVKSHVMSCLVSGFAPSTCWDSTGDEEKVPILYIHPESTCVWFSIANFFLDVMYVFSVSVSRMSKMVCVGPKPLETWKLANLVSWWCLPAGSQEYSTSELVELKSPPSMMILSAGGSPADHVGHSLTSSQRYCASGQWIFQKISVAHLDCV